MSDVTVSVLHPSVELRRHRLTGAFLAGYRNANTRTAYLQQLHRWFAWCTAHQLDPLEPTAARQTYIVCLGDPDPTPELPHPWERALLDTGHWPMLTAPKALIDLLEQLATP